MRRRVAMTPFGREAAQDRAHLPGTPNGHRGGPDNGPGDSTPAAMFGWTGLDERTQSAEGVQYPVTGINRWWIAFDARYMQPVFGGPQHPLAAERGDAAARASGTPRMDHPL